jgi:hypothetical protein
METSHLLKQEINQTLESLHDFAKWKLIVSAFLASAALGLPSGKGKVWVLLLIPYASAYIDLNCYQYLIRITVLARGLREFSDDELLRSYEGLCEQLREKYGVFNLGRHAQIAVSLGISAAPAFAVFEYLQNRMALIICIVVWGIGIGLIVKLWLYFLSKNSSAGSGDIEPVGKSRAVAAAN